MTGDAGGATGKRRALGRGLDALLPTAASSHAYGDKSVFLCALDKIVPRELAENAAVVAVTAYALANLEQPIPR